MIQLSVVIITLNEERNIARCLDSVKEIADEIVIIDSYSTDNTESICKSYGARVIQHPFKGYGYQKNFANTQATNDHILSLDADEVLSNELLQSVKEVKENFNADGYTMNRLTNYAGKWIHHSGWYPDVKLRLFNRKKGEWTGLLIHEKYEMYAGSKVKHLKGDLLHYSFSSVESHKKQSEKFAQLGAEAYFEKGKKAPMLKIIVAPIVRFVRDYFFNLGFLDGKEGFIICRISARSTYSKYRKLRDLYKEQDKAKASS